MSDDNGSVTALTPSEEAFFESGGTTDHGLTDDQSGAGGGDGGESGQQQNNQDGGQADPNTQQGEQAPKPEKTVPLAALHQARHELREAKARSDRLEATFQHLLRLQQGQGQQQQVPDQNVDPLGHFEARSAQLEAQIQQLTEQRQQEAQQTQQQAQERQFTQAVSQVEAQFIAKTPDYNEATQFLQQNLVEGFLNQGYSEQEAVQGMRQQIRGMIHQFFQLGLNPAEMGYTIAKARGFAPKAAAAANQQQANGEKISQLNKGQAAARSLSTAGGAGKPAITLEALAEMDPAELEKHWGEVSKLM